MPTRQPWRTALRLLVGVALLWPSAPALGQTLEGQTNLMAGYVNVNGQMHGGLVQIDRQSRGHIGYFAEFNVVSGPDCSRCQPKYRDLTAVGGIRINWRPGSRVTAYAQAGVGVLSSRASEYSYDQPLPGGRTVRVTDPAFTVNEFALQPGGGVTYMLSPRFGVRGQATLQFGVPDQSQWEGITLFQYIGGGAVFRF